MADEITGWDEASKAAQVAKAKEYNRGYDAGHAAARKEIAAMIQVSSFLTEEVTRARAEAKAWPFPDEEPSSWAYTTRKGGLRAGKEVLEYIEALEYWVDTLLPSADVTLRTTARNKLGWSKK